MVRPLRYFLVIACGATLSIAAEPKHTYMPAAGYVPDAATAIKIAVAVWEPIYGAKQIAGEKPFHAALHRGVWTVQGSLPEKTPGGVALAEISQKDGRIMRVSHGK
jgi:NTF2 fold immunity protein